MPITRTASGLLAVDDFTRADSTNLGSDWNEETGDWSIASNRLQTSATGFARLIHTGISASKMFVQGVLHPTSSATEPRLHARWAVGANGYGLVASVVFGDDVELGLWVNNDFTLLDSAGVSIPLSTDHVAQLYVADGVQQAHILGVALSAADASFDGVDASAGFGSFDGPGTNIYDDFLCFRDKLIVVGPLPTGYKAKILNAASAVVAEATEFAGTATIDASRVGGATEDVPFAGWSKLIVTDAADVEQAEYTATTVFPGDAYNVTISPLAPTARVEVGGVPPSAAGPFAQPIAPTAQVLVRGVPAFAVEAVSRATALLEFLDAADAVLLSSELTGQLASEYAFLADIANVAPAGATQVAVTPVKRGVGTNTVALKDLMLYAGRGTARFTPPARTMQPVVSVTAAHTLHETTKVVLADATAGSFTVTLAPSAACHPHGVRRVNHTGSANTVTVEGFGSELIDGAANITLSGGQRAAFLPDGTGWVQV